MPIRYNSIDNRIVYSKTPLTSIMKGSSNCIYGNDIGYSTIFNYTKSSESVTITSLTEYGKQLSVIKVPSKIEDLSVTELSSSSFNDCTNLISVTIPGSVTSIGLGAFSGCVSLESMTTPFVGAEAGKTAEDTYQYPFGYIFGESYYTGGTAVRQTYYGSSTSSTTSTTYYIPSSLRSVTVTGGNILYGAFDNCSILTSVTLSDSMTSIGERAFGGCSSLETLTVAEGNAVYHSAGNCIIETATKTLIVGCKGSVIPDDGSVTSIGWGAFFNCTTPTSIVIPNSVTSIGDHGFHGCTSLSITIGNGVTSIGDSAFDSCTSLTSVTIGNSVTSIGDGVFMGCDSLTSIHYTGDMVSWLEKTWHSKVMSSGRMLYIGGNKVEGELVIPNGIASIPSYAFAYQTGITSVAIPDSVTSIGARAFDNCKSLTSIVIPDSVTSIGDYAFRGCTSLTSVTIGDGVTSIGNYAFRDCTAEIIWGGTPTITAIGSYAFAGYAGTSITIPDSVTSIRNYAFSDCTSLTSVTFEDTSGWQVSTSLNFSSYTELSSSNLVNTSTAARYLTTSYARYYWRKV